MYNSCTQAYRIDDYVNTLYLDQLFFTQVGKDGMPSSVQDVRDLCARIYRELPSGIKDFFNISDLACYFKRNQNNYK